MKINFTLIIIFSLSACEMKEINITDLNISENSHQFEIAIDCYITTEFAHHYIKLTKPANYNENTQLLAISNALVSISSNGNNYNFSETDELGIYISDDEFAPQVGNNYNLSVQKDKKEYFAKDSVVAVSEIIFSQSPLPVENTNVTSQDFIYFNGSKHSFGYKENTKWLWLYPQSPLNEYKNPFSSDLTFNYTHIGGEPQGLFSDVSYGFGIGGEINDTVIVRKYSISDKHYKYLVALFSESEWKAGIFSTISGNLPTNISKGGTGYFYIMDMKLKKITIEELLKQK